MSYRRVNPSELRGYQSRKIPISLFPVPQPSASRGPRRTSPSEATYDSICMPHRTHHTRTVPNSITGNHRSPAFQYSRAGFELERTGRTLIPDDKDRRYGRPRNKGKPHSRELLNEKQTTLHCRNSYEQTNDCPQSYPDRQFIHQSDFVNHKSKRPYSEKFSDLPVKISRTESYVPASFSRDEFGDPGRIARQPKQVHNSSFPSFQSLTARSIHVDQSRDVKQLNTVESAIYISDSEDDFDETAESILPKSGNQHPTATSQNNILIERSQKRRALSLFCNSPVSDCSPAHEDMRVKQRNFSSMAADMHSSFVDVSQRAMNKFAPKADDVDLTYFELHHKPPEDSASPLFRDSNTAPKIQQEYNDEMTSEFCDPFIDIELFKTQNCELRYENGNDLFVSDTPTSSGVRHSQPQSGAVADMDVDEEYLCSNEDVSSEGCAQAPQNQILDSLNETYGSEIFHAFASNTERQHEGMIDTRPDPSRKSPETPLNKLFHHSDICGYPPLQTHPLEGDNASSHSSFNNTQTQIVESQRTPVNNMIETADFAGYAANTVGDSPENSQYTSDLCNGTPRDFNDENSLRLENFCSADGLDFSQVFETLMNEAKFLNLRPQKYNEKNGHAQIYSSSVIEVSHPNASLSETTSVPICEKPEEVEDGEVEETGELISSQSLARKLLDEELQQPEDGGEVPNCSEKQQRESNVSNGLSIPEDCKTGGERHQPVTKSELCVLSAKHVQNGIDLASDGVHAYVLEQSPASSHIVKLWEEIDFNRDSPQVDHFKNKEENPNQGPSLIDSSKKPRREENCSLPTISEIQMSCDTRSSWKANSVSSNKSIDYNDKRNSGYESQAVRYDQFAASSHEYKIQKSRFDPGFALKPSTTSTRRTLSSHSISENSVSKYQSHLNKLSSSVISKSTGITSTIPNSKKHSGSSDTHEAGKTPLDQIPKHEDIQVIDCKEATNLIKRPSSSKQQTERQQGENHRNDHYHDKSLPSSYLRAPIANMYKPRTIQARKYDQFGTHATTLQSVQQSPVAYTVTSEKETPIAIGNTQEESQVLGCNQLSKKSYVATRTAESGSSSTSLTPRSLNSSAKSGDDRKRSVPTEQHIGTVLEGNTYSTSYPQSASGLQNNSFKSSSKADDDGAAVRKKRRQERQWEPLSEEEVTANDWLLVDLYQEGFTWEAIMRIWSEKTGVRRGQKSLALRYRRMYLTFPNSVSPPKSLSHLSIDSRPRANAPSPSKGFITEQNAQPTAPPPGVKSVEQSEKNKSGITRLSPIQAERQPDDNEILLSEEGVKQFLSDELQVAQNVDISEVEEDEHELSSPDDDHERQYSPIQEDDMTHYVYVVERRVYHENEVDSLEDRSRKGWRNVSREFLNPVEASHAAFKNMMREHEDDEQPSVWPLVEWHCICDRDHKGLPWWTGRNQDDYIVEVRVKRSLNKWLEGKLPEDKRGWLPRFVWDVWERRTETLIFEVADEPIAEGDDKISSTSTRNALETAAIVATEKNQEGCYVDLDFEKTLEDLSKLLDESDGEDNDVDENRTVDNCTHPWSQERRSSGISEQTSLEEQHDSCENASYIAKLPSEHNYKNSTSTSNSNSSYFAVPKQAEQESCLTDKGGIVANPQHTITTTIYNAVGGIHHLLDKANRAAGKRYLELQREFLVPTSKRFRIDTIEKIQRWDREMEKRLDELEMDEAVFDEEEVVKDVELAVPQTRDYTGKVVQREGKKKVSVSIGVVKRVLEAPRNF